jgi:hypothetical protein
MLKDSRSRLRFSMRRTQLHAKNRWFSTKAGELRPDAALAHRALAGDYLVAVPACGTPVVVVERLTRSCR